MQVSSRILAFMLALAAASAPLRAEETDDGDTEDRSSLWHMAFVGGGLVPLRDMADTYKNGLSIGARLGWTSAVGIGLELSTNYSPLARTELPALTSIETHFGTASAGPRFALGDTFRIWISAGGGVAFERSTERFRDVKVQTSTEAAPMFTGSAGIDLNFLSSGGLTIIGSGHKTYGGDLDYELVQVIGGLMFTFQ